MTEKRNLPANHKVLSGSVLKLIALFTMILDHTASVLLQRCRFAMLPLFRIGPFAWSLFKICRIIGRCAFPLYAFLLVEGFLHTRNQKRYGINLFLFALISEIPWNLEHTGTLTYAGQNVFFTLFLGYLALVCYEKFRIFPLKQWGSLLLIVTATVLLSADHGASGVALVLVLYFLKENHLMRTVIGCCIAGMPVYSLPPFLMMSLYNGERGFVKGKWLKYVFYIAYPGHLLILYFLRRHYFGY